MPQLCSSPIKFEESLALRADPLLEQVISSDDGDPADFWRSLPMCNCGPTPAGQLSFETIGAVDLAEQGADRKSPLGCYDLQLQ